MNIFNFAKIVLAVVMFWSLCFINNKTNLKKTERGRQFLMPFITVIYCIVAVIFLNNIVNLILKLMLFIESYFPFMENLNTELFLTYAVNIVLVLGHNVVKTAVLPIINLIWSSDGVMEFTSSVFYEKEVDVDKWLLKSKFCKVRDFVRFAYYGVVIESLLLFILSLYFPQWAAFKAVLYPFFGILIMGEAINYLSGMTKSEFVEEILGEDEESYKVANYGMLRKILRDLYPSRVLYENTLDATNSISDTFDALNEMTGSEDRLERVMSEYYLALKQNNENVDVNYVKSSINLLKGNSTLFNNPFYKDLTNYIIVPMTKHLISYKKCLIIVGRDSVADDVETWVSESVSSFTGTNSLWKSRVLDETYMETDIGIVKFSDIYNIKMHHANKEFLQNVGFVLLIEPSRILASGQIGLNLLVNECETQGKKIVYCACDRNCDGLVDALSHTLKTSITQVTATLSGGSNSSQMYWNADGAYMHHKILPNVTRYLGMGTEINAVALKYQLKETGWIGSEKFPVNDIKWIAGQYYKEICDYADMPKSQDAFNRAFKVESNLWSCPQKDNVFLVVEDEFQNLFETTRTFASRARKQGFINVISENYFLRDYMLDNVDVFRADPKAIPTIVPDYARTERNTVLKLIMLMVHNPISEEVIEKELMLSGIIYEDAYETLKALIEKHCNVEDASLSVMFKEKFTDDSLNSKTVKYYEINETNELYSYANTLKNAYYIAEDEEGERYYVGARLYSHVFQSMLPGQFMTFDGKYYEVCTITPLNGVVVRRAADHINNRKYYRQIRNYKLNNFVTSEEMGSVKVVSGIELIHGFADFSVDTEGYIEMTSYGDFKGGQTVLINNIPTRNYRNKSILKIRLPEISEQAKYTLCLVLNEIFRTTYPDTHQYITVVAPNTENVSENLKYATYGFEGECEADCIYIIEDSDVDLGLIVSVERNLKRYLEIVADVLAWHTEKMLEVPETTGVDEEYVPEFIPEEPAETEKRGFFGKIKDFFGRIFGKKKAAPAEEEKQPVSKPADTEVTEETAPEVAPEATEEPVEKTPEEETKKEEKKVGVFAKIKNFFGKLFGRKKGKEEVSEEAEEIEAAEEAEGVAEENVAKEATPPADETKDGDAEEEKVPVLNNMSNILRNDIQAEDVEDTNVQEEDVAESDISGEDEEIVDAEKAMTEYQKHCFLKFGYDTIDATLDIAALVEYLSKFGFNKGPLQQARKKTEEIEAEYDPHKYGAHLCDFCGVELLGGEYEVLKDGRERCNRCSMTAVKTLDGFKDVYKGVVRNLEIFYNIKINTAIKVRTTDAKTIAKHVGMTFTPTPGFDGRVLGFAKKDKTGYSIYIENGSPRLAAIATIAHELTHIWQYLNWNDAEINKRYGKANALEIYEGMAKWVEIQYLILLNEHEYAKRQEIMTRMRDDAYGRGFVKFAEKYPITYETNLSGTPFEYNPPL